MRSQKTLGILKHGYPVSMNGGDMEGKVSLRAIVDAVEQAAPGSRAFLNCRTGRLLTFLSETLSAAEAPPGEALPDWLVDEVALFREAERSPEWVEAPLRETSTDYAILEEFCTDQPDGAIRDDLLEEIQGPGAFRRFREAVRRHELMTQWDEYRRRKIEAYTAMWLEAQGLPFGD